MSNLINFKNSIIKDGGASYNLLTGEFNPREGYMVSIKDHELIIPYDPEGLQYEISRYIKSKADILISGMSDNKFLGAWVDEGKLYLDVSLHIYSKEEAISIARAEEQKAYYDCKGGKSINL